MRAIQSSKHEDFTCHLAPSPSARKQSEKAVNRLDAISMVSSVYESISSWFNLPVAFPTSSRDWRHSLELPASPSAGGPLRVFNRKTRRCVRGEGSLNAYSLLRGTRTNLEMRRRPIQCLYHRPLPISPGLCGSSFT